MAILKYNNFKTLNWRSVLIVALLLAIAAHLWLVMNPTEFTYKDIPLIAVIIMCGIPLVLQILLKLLKGNLGADMLAGIAIITGTYLGEYLAVTIVMLMLATGQMLEVYALRKASSVLRALAERMPSIAHRQTKNSIEDIPIKKIKLRDTIVIYPHETCPVDGTVLTGHGSMDESFLTGEPYHISKAPGVEVISGAINGQEMLTIRCDKLPKDSRYANIMRVMGESEQRRPKFRRLGDQLGAIFAPLTLVVAFATLYFTGDPVRLLAVLVIATPCPLLIAIPVAIISAISLSARKGIIIKDPVVLERLPICKTAIFDKTGTLTYGQPELVEIYTLPGFDKNTVLQQVASIEIFSKHPLAAAIIKANDLAKLPVLPVERINEAPGQGLIGHINGQIIKITSRAKLNTTTVLPPVKHGMECVVVIDEQIAALFYFHDTLRLEGQSFIKHLAPIHNFEKIMIVSGDRISEVEYIAKQLGVKEIFASQSPEQKVEIVRSETAKSPTLFMGDGINDAPALAAATVGIAFGQQNVGATEAAGAVILENSLAKVDELIHISTQLRRIVLISAGGGMLLSVIGMYFAAIGMISPVMGALIQEGIDIIAILGALQLTWQSQVRADIKMNSDL